MKKIQTLIILIFLCIFNGFAQNPNLGTSGAQFLKIPIGAQSAALGGAVTGIVDDANAVFWNPAGLSKVKSNAVHFSYMRWFDMFDVNAAAFVRNFESIGTFGIGILVFKTDKMEITTENEPNGTGRFFDAQDISLGLSYSRFLTDYFSAGITLKYIHQRIWDETANGIAFDVGTQYQVEFQNLIIAMSMTNFGADMKMEGPDLSVKYDPDQFLQNRLIPSNYETEYYPLPLNFQFGLSFDVFDSRYLKIRGSVDAVHPNDNNERIQFGAETAVFDRLYLRGGYKLNHDDEDLNFGAGFRSNFGTFLIKIDYAYSFYDILPDVQFISIGLEF
ncbi:PorV/PorQ family protein [Calditrichota bacterium]